MLPSGPSELQSQVHRFCETLRQAGISAISWDVDLRTVSRWKIGGIAHCLLDPVNTNEIAFVLALAGRYRLPVVVVGHGSNLFFSDQGVRVPILRLGRNFSRVELRGQAVWCEAGAWVPGLASKISDAGLDGAQHIIGIPGTIGGLIAMNGGSQRRGIGENVESVLCVTSSGKTVKLERDECQFRYRHSIFQDSDLIACEINLRFQAGDRNKVRREMRAILRSRRARFPRKQPNCGSVFVSDPGLYESFGAPGMVIERLGMKNLRSGDAQVSDRHANFIVNLGSATARDVLDLIHRIRIDVHTHTGRWMACEVRYVHPDGRVDFAHNVTIEAEP